MRYINKNVAFSQIDWRSSENLLRLGAFLAAVVVVVTAILLYQHLSFSHLGYAGVALSALVASGGLVLPVPALAVACTASVLLFPLLVGIVAGSAETVGELTGYFLGYSGRGLVTHRRFHGRLENWMRRRGWLVLFTLSVVPNPVFDVAGITAGASRYPVWGFLGIVLAGKLIKFTAIAYACAYSIQGITRLFE